jgi:hypothetical protein
MRNTLKFVKFSPPYWIRFNEKTNGVLVGALVLTKLRRERGKSRKDSALHYPRTALAAEKRQGGCARDVADRLFATYWQHVLFEEDPRGRKVVATSDRLAYYSRDEQGRYEGRFQLDP